MKSLKFKPHLCEKILRGEKTATWRLFDDKDLQVGDTINLLNSETGDSVAVATIRGIKIKTLGTLEDADWVGHERYGSEQAMYDAYRNYYGDSVGPDSTVKLIDFTMIANKED